MEANSNANNPIPAILILTGQKTYGRNKSNVPLYKCIPDKSANAEPMLVGYNMKTMGFSKVFYNLYVIVKRDGTMCEVLGQVNDAKAFAEYQMVCKNVRLPYSKLTKELIRQKIKTNSTLAFTDEEINNYNILDRRDEKIYTIDPQQCTDFDDAFSVKKIENEKSNQVLLTIYIANVPIVLDKFQLWDFLSERVATIYLPDCKRPMLPSALSEGICSLKEGQDRIAFAMEFIVNANSNTNSNQQFQYQRHYNCLIRVCKNYVYEEPALLSNQEYQLLKSYFPIDVTDSHDIVERMMIEMNHASAKLLIQNKTGIFRTVSKKEGINSVNTDTDATSIQTQTTITITTINTNNIKNKTDIQAYNRIYNWKCMHGQYEIYDVSKEQYIHATLDLDCYAHITSPIRRWVDMINMSQLCLDPPNYPLILRHCMTDEKIQVVNAKMKGTQQVQNACHLLHMITNNPSLTKHILDGYIFDDRMVYLPSINFICKFYENQLQTNLEPEQEPEQELQNVNQEKQKSKFKIYLFTDEHTLYKKVRVMKI